MDISIISTALRMAAPLMFASLGGLFSEKSGTVNIGLEGMMLVGAFSAAAGTEITGNPWLGLLIGASAGGLLALLHGFISITLSGSQIVSGIAINILAYGICPVICNWLYGTPTSTPLLANRLPAAAPMSIKTIPVIGTILTDISLLVPVGFIAVIAAHFVMKRTAFGLHIRAAGENPEMLDTAGVNVVSVRYKAVLISGLLAGIGGAYLSIAHGSQFIRLMTAGRGYIALAILIIANWKAMRIIGISLFIGLLDGLQIRLQSSGIIPQEIVQILPYAITMLILIGFFGKPTQPKALGVPYSRGKL